MGKQNLKQVDKGGKKRRARKEAAAPVAPGELGDWTIRVPPSPSLKAVLADKQADCDEEICQLEAEIEVSAAAHKLLKNKKTDEIGEVRNRLAELRHEVRYGTTATRRCYRKRDGDEWIYLGLEPPHGELWREPATDGQQQRLVGKETTGRSSGLDEMLSRARAGTWVALSDGQPWCHGPHEATGWPECELSWHPRVRWCQERLLQEAPWPEDGSGQEDGYKRQPLKFTRTRLDGQPAYRAEVPGGEYRVERGEPTGGPGKPLLQAYWAPTEGERLALPGEHVKVVEAQAEAEQHWQSRLVWLGDERSGVLVDTTNSYQLQRDIRDGDWMAIFVGGLDEKAKELGGGDLDEAKEACQGHADAGRWTR